MKISYIGFICVIIFPFSKKENLVKSLLLRFESMTCLVSGSILSASGLSLSLLFSLFSPVPSHQNAVTKDIFLSHYTTMAATSSIMNCPLRSYSVPCALAFLAWACFFFVVFLASSWFHLLYNTSNASVTQTVTNIKSMSFISSVITLEIHLLIKIILNLRNNTHLSLSRLSIFID